MKYEYYVKYNHPGTGEEMFTGLCGDFTDAKLKEVMLDGTIMRDGEEVKYHTNGEPAQAAHATYAGSGEIIRKDYMRRLIRGVRAMIEYDPDTINAKKELGDGVTISRWIDAKILCNIIEDDVLYTHAAPAVPDKRKNFPHLSVDSPANSYVNGWNACREALIATSKEAK